MLEFASTQTLKQCCDFFAEYASAFSERGFLVPMKEHVQLGMGGKHPSTLLLSC